MITFWLWGRPKHSLLPTGETSHDSQGQHGANQDGETVVSHGHDGCNEERLVSQLRDDDDGESSHKGMDEAQLSFAGVILTDYWADGMWTRGFLQREIVQ